MTKVRAACGRVEARFDAMGREARVVVLGGRPRADERARHVIEVLERKWGRFRAGSEMARINATAGRAVVVSPETYGLVERAVAAWWVTGGRFDPCVPSPSESARAAGSALPRPGCGRIRLDATLRSVRLPAGVQLDVTGIATGFALDLVVADLLQNGAAGALVSLGTDVRMGGDPPRPEGWFVDVDHPFRPGPLARLRLADGAVCTVAARRPGAGGWAPTGIDQAAGTGVASMTVVAGEAWWAQAIARAAFVAGPEAGTRVLAEHGVTGLLVGDDGEVRAAPGLRAFL